MEERQAPHSVQRQQHFHKELFVLSFERKRKTIDDAVNQRRMRLHRWSDIDNHDKNW